MVSTAMNEESKTWSVSPALVRYWNKSAGGDEMNDGDGWFLTGRD